MKSAAEYHVATSYDRLKMEPHYMDWANQPRPYKTYPGQVAIALPGVAEFPEALLWDLIRTSSRPEKPVELDLNTLAQIFTLGDGITARGPHGDFYFRTQASAGALYPNEIYLAAYDIKGLKPGLYHYAIRDMSLTALRKGDFSGYVSDATRDAAGKNLAATFFITGIFFRSAWKYRARAFRYVLLDAGHLLENFILALKTVKLSFSLYYDFEDEKLNRLLGIDSEKEACLACVHVRGTPSGKPRKTGLVDPLSPELIEASRVSDREITYKEIRQIYQGGNRIVQNVTLEPDMISSLGITPSTWIQIPGGIKTETELDYAKTVVSRRSKRNYIGQTLPGKLLMRLLELVWLSTNQDIFPESQNPRVGVTGLLAANIEGVESGFYVMDADRQEIGLVTNERMVDKMAAVCLNQEWLRNASIHFLFMSNLRISDNNYGPRGYRHAMLEAGRLGKAIYLGATSLGLGSCGIGALYDGEARELLGLNNDSFLLYLVAAGLVKKPVFNISEPGNSQ
ncbi:SagB/ThcOx family dehydrogenase [Thermodesulfobacteriota bacterium]